MGVHCDRRERGRLAALPTGSRQRVTEVVDVAGIEPVIPTDDVVLTALQAVFN